MNSSIAFIGGGNMASALIAGLFQTGSSADAITVVERDAAQRARLAETFNICTPAFCDEVSNAPEVVVWALKPQVLQAVATQLPRSMSGALHVSNAAGILTTDLCLWLGTHRVVGAMPNTAAMVSGSVTGPCAAAGATSADRQLAERIMQGTGLSSGSMTTSE